MSCFPNDVDALLMVGTSEKLADLYYATRFRAPDDFIFVWTQNEKLLLVNSLEVDRAREEADVDRVLQYTDYENKVRASGGEDPSQENVIITLLLDLQIKTVHVPEKFPIGLGDTLRSKGWDLRVLQDPLFPNRQIKTNSEIECIRNSQKAAEAGMNVAINLLRKSDIHRGKLVLNDEVLTSERIRRAIHIALMDLECIANHTIVACGEQGCDPHQEGHGPILANEPIIIDIFPCHSGNGYFGDITRTVVKGEPSQRVMALYETVLQAQEMALKKINHGADGREIHKTIQHFFSSKGYETKQKGGFIQGFFHGTGHGVGLEIHEAPRISQRKDILQSGQVVTVEPGLYYRGIGGVRIEDTVVVRSNGCENLSSFPKRLELT
ncbi:MAG: Xaa-Pro peptidase family protein [Candidatus Latescibacterota bacterium]|nr:Xaa-Pro peptidase family protein [Candidatus Latescibacterota bacterium]